VAAVSRDDRVRLELARAFDAAPAEWRVTLHTDVPDEADVVVFGPDIPHDGGIGFDPENPTELIADIGSSLAADECRALFVITGTGGGVGVTTVALHLAMSAARDRSTCCVGGRGTALRLDLPPDVPRWTDGLRAEGSTTPVAGSFRVLLAPTDRRSAIDAALESFDTVIVDGTISDADTFERAKAVVLVFPPTVPGARSARQLVDEHPDVRWALVANRLGPGGEMTRVALEQILERRIAVELPTCAPLRDAEDDGSLLTSNLYRWPRRLAQLWTTLERS
jgi:hypothetical protein